MIRLLFTTGRGPIECRIALRLALERLVKDAAAAGVACEVSTHDMQEPHGPASAIVLLASDAHPAVAEDFARAWTGSLLWVSASSVRPNHKRKNWYIGSTRLPEPPRQPTAIRAEDVRFSALRAGGPGGQHQNKTESAVRAVHVSSGRCVVVRDGRSQHRNKALALQRIAALLASDAELDAARDAERRHATHDALERGRPVRTFRGASFKEG